MNAALEATIAVNDEEPKETAEEKKAEEPKEEKPTVEEEENQSKLCPMMKKSRSLKKRLKATR